ncbi:MAG: AAA family ATPase [Deltaproteobacteria bacterium]|nr:MAG: AAA family ATPase [Deltaproteobacteria bacterium]
MYTAFYGLREKPFALSPDPRYLFLAESHREALAHLLYGIDEGEGFIAITGEVGTGKTTLCRTLLQRVGAGTEIAFLFNPLLSPAGLVRAINVEFGLRSRGRSLLELSDELNRFLLEKNRDGRRVLLIIDEAQNLSTDTLEQIRLLSNLETERSKLIQIVLLGQPELEQKLGSAELRQLRQRIGVHWRLDPLTAAETRDYVRHRLRIAAGAERDLFTERALKQVHRCSGGIPRLVNVLCERALLAGYAANASEIGPALVLTADREQRQQGISAPRARRIRWTIAGPLLLAASLAAGFGIGRLLGAEFVPPWRWMEPEGIGVPSTARALDPEPKPATEVREPIESDPAASAAEPTDPATQDGGARRAVPGPV